MRRLIPISAVAALAITFSGTAFAAETVNFLLDWLPAGDKAAVYLGAEKGLFEAEGIKVNIQSGRGSSDVVTKLATGSADMGTGGLAALLQAKATDNVPVKAILSIYTLQPDAIFTTKESGINDLKDLQGKTVATATFSSSNVSWPLVLKANGVDAEKIKLLKVDPGALAPMLASGKVDATINWVTVAPAFAGPLNEPASRSRNCLGRSTASTDTVCQSLFPTR
jgi:NitT/TauT family transport system substrate-binding protein